MTEDINPFTNRGAALLLGQKGEEAVATLLQERDLEVKADNGYHGHDIVINDRVSVDVKTALPTLGSSGNKQRWQFMLYKRGQGRPVEANLLILRCQADIGDGRVWHFVIPSTALPPKLTKIDITSNPEEYRGKWSVYLDAWDHVTETVIQANVEGWPEYSKQEIPF